MSILGLLKFERTEPKSGLSALKQHCKDDGVTFHHITDSVGIANETDDRRISENFNANKERYQIGKHYYLLKGEDLKKFKGEVTNCDVATNVNQLYVWTEKGALLHAKSLDIDEVTRLNLGGRVGETNIINESG